MSPLQIPPTPTQLKMRPLIPVQILPTPLRILQTRHQTFFPPCQIAKSHQQLPLPLFNVTLNCHPISSSVSLPRDLHHWPLDPPQFLCLFHVPPCTSPGGQTDQLLLVDQIAPLIPVHQTLSGILAAIHFQTATDDSWIALCCR